MRKTKDKLGNAAINKIPADCSAQFCIADLKNKYLSYAVTSGVPRGVWRFKTSTEIPKFYKVEPDCKFSVPTPTS
jgi:hypothetical protein